MEKLKKVEKLVREKPFSTLNEAERNLVLTNMSAEDYEAERAVVLLSEKLKTEQAYLAPSTALRDELLAKMALKNPPKRVRLLPYGIAASLLILMSLYYFLKKEKYDSPRVDETIVAKPTVVLPDLMPKMVVSDVKISPKRKFLKQPTRIVNEASDDDLLQTFHRKNPNLEWQTEEEDEVLRHVPSFPSLDK